MSNPQSLMERIKTSANWFFGTKIFETKNLAKPMIIHIGSNVCEQPFFQPIYGKKNLYHSRSLTFAQRDNENFPGNVLDIVQESLVGPSIRDIYRGLKDQDHGFVINDWCFLSAKEIGSREAVYKPKMLDFALQYNGMGHIIVISYIPRTDRFFFRHDGGANYWDREEHYKEYSDDKFIPSELPIYDHGILDTKVKLNMLMQYSYHDMMQIIDPLWIF